MHAVVNYPAAWKQHYQNHGLHRKDPALRHAARSTAPVFWGRLQDDPMYHAVFSRAHDFGIPDMGVTIPVRGPYGDRGMLSVTRRMTAQRWDTHSQRIMTRLQQCAALLHDQVMQQSVLMQAMRAPSLSARETEILQWVAAGKSHADIGQILTISVRTVEVHLRSCRSKLGALTTAQAVARAIGMRMIYPI